MLAQILTGLSWISLSLSLSIYIYIYIISGCSYFKRRPIVVFRLEHKLPNKMQEIKLVSECLNISSEWRRLVACTPQKRTAHY
jgi:hypothetical protein